jgi:hypothetical protein
MRSVTVFEQADRAAVVAIGRRVGAAFRAREVPKGNAPRGVVRIPTQGRGTSCRPRMRGGRDVLLFTDGRGQLVAHYQSWREHPDAALLDAVRAYLGAGDDGARRQLLAGLAGATGPLQSEAAHHLVNRPDLLRAVTPRERARLLTAIGHAEDHALSMLAWVAARLHVTEAVPVLIDAMDRLGPTSYVEQIAIPLELLTNHRQPLDGPASTAEGQRFYEWRMRIDLSHFAASIADRPAPTPTSASVAHWRAWHRQNATQTAQTLYRQGFFERGLTVPPPDDPAALADAVRRGPDSVTRIVALDRCEQHWGVRLYHFPSYATGVADHVWATLADACSAGRSPDGL